MASVNRKPKSLFQKYQDKARKNSIAPMTKASREWFNDMLSSGQFKVSRSKLLRDPLIKIATTPIIGKMYMFRYDPKHKKTLPYYDRFPLIIFADLPQKGEGFFGLNLHYLRPRERALFLSNLMKYSSTGTKLKENTQLKISYKLLKSASKMRAYAPTFKRYLANHVNSSITEVPPEYWELAVWLPTQEFKKSSPSQVWSLNK